MAYLRVRHSHRRLAITLVLTLFVLTTGCGGFSASQVSPDEIPELEARLQTEPNNGQVVLRYAAALFAANRCEAASEAARRGMALRPADALGPLVLGQCLEAEQDYDRAIGVYDTFSAANPDARGVGSVESRALLARRARATVNARAVLANEQNLTPLPPNAGAVAVLPLTIVGDSQYQALSRGLAQMLISDLALLERFALVERMQLNALLDEIEFSQGDRVDPNTAVRVGMLTRAGRMVSGLAAIPDEGDVRLEATVVLSTGEVTAPSASTGRLRDLLLLEKEIVVDISSQLGYTLSQAEREAILENGTDDLVAFLAYSNGLLAEDAGDYGSAAVFYQQAVQADPNFQQARSSYRQSAAAPSVQAATAGQVTTMASEEIAPAASETREPVGEVLSVVGDLAATESETTDTGDNAVTSDTRIQAVSGGTSGGANDAQRSATRTTISTVSETTTTTGTTSSLTGTIRIVFVIP